MSRLLTLGAFIFDVHTFFGLFDLTPSPSVCQIYMMSVRIFRGIIDPPPFPFCADVLYGSPHPPIKTRRNSLSQSFVSSLSHVNRWYRRQATRRSTWFFWAARRAPWRTRCTSTRRPAPSGSWFVCCLLFIICLLFIFILISLDSWCAPRARPTPTGSSRSSACACPSTRATRRSSRCTTRTASPSR